MSNSGLSYCGKLVREQDPDRFLVSMFAPSEVRESLWALFAFNHEIAKTREVVSETQLGLIRLQWWRDAIAKIYEVGVTLEHEVLQPLAQAIQAYDLPREHFDTLIYAREFDLEDVLPANLEGLLNYADFTSTPLLKLALQITGGDPETEPVQPVAVSYALAGILRSVTFYAKQRRCYLPEDMMEQHGVGIQNQLYELKAGEGLSAVIREVSQEIIFDVKSQNVVIKSLQKLTKMHLRQMRDLKYDVFNPKVSLDPPFRVLRVFFSVM